MPRVLIAGTSPLLAGRLAARCLADPAETGRGTEVVLLSAARSRPGEPAPDRRELARFVARCGGGEETGAERLTV
ncbi:hypothetical protein, partial [Streptomyces sp. SPB074]|uniref:hypothetical protein n=1 Tax=Streptomyces sp. (strain SPB074) TaxID=465543 RepID=UPI00055E26EF